MKGINWVLIQFSVILCLLTGCGQEIPVPFTVSEKMHTSLKETGEVIHSRDSVVKVLKKTDTDEAFVVKQLRQPEPERLLIEAWIANTALSLGIPVVQTWIIPNKTEFLGKTYPKQQASLQVKAPGKSLSDFNSYIQIAQKAAYQGVRNEKTQAYYEQSLKTAGLTKRVIAWMSLHPDLAKIAALDTFVNNADRVRENIFYDKQKNRYVAIDHASALQENHLAEHALRQLKSHQANKVRFSKKEIVGLKLYVETLKKLQATNQVQNAKKQLTGYAKFLKISNLEAVVLYSEVIQRQNRAIVPLIEFLENFLYDT